MSDTRARRLSAPPVVSLSARLQRAAVSALITAVVASLCFLVLAFMATAIRNRNEDAVLDVGGLCYRAGVLSAILFAFLTPTLLLLSTRPMQDRAFTVAGFLATFFGFAMLILFFGLLIFGSWIGFGVIDIGRGSGVIEWFEFAPKFVEAENQRLLDAPKTFEREQLAEIKRQMKEEIADAEKSVDHDPDSKDLPAAERAKLKAEKRAEVIAVFEEDIIPNKKRALEPTLAELRREAEQGVRTDTSWHGMLYYFLTHGPSDQKSPQDAGVRPALLGSLYLGMITVLFAVTIGVGAAIYLEEYRADSWISRIIQVNINNLAGVPSVVYGILGAFVFVEMIFKPLHLSYGWIQARNVLAGGLTLGLLTLPIVIVSAQEAIRAVPGSIRHGAIALGATKWQTIWRTVLPMAVPGILTGSILSLSRAVGEAAPLVMLGAAGYIASDPSLFGPFTALPMQIFLFADLPPLSLADGESIEMWKGTAAMASIILLAALLCMNGLAIYLRNRAQRGSRY
jgi:phosphate transport system permease protein